MAKKKFEDSMKRLEDIVQSFEGGELSLEDSIDTFEEGMQLVAFCSKSLEDAEQKVTMLIKEHDGKYSQQPFETGEKEES